MNTALERAAGAKPIAFHAALTDSLPGLRRYGLMLTRNRAAMEDLVQTTAVRALAAETGFAAGSNFGAWISRILYNEFISGVRRQRLFTSSDPLVVEEIASPARQEDHLILRELVGAINHLPPPQRKALLLSTVDGLNYEEIAAAMRCRTGTVKSRIGRARLQLQRALSGIAQGDESPATCPTPVRRGAAARHLLPHTRLNGRSNPSASITFLPTIRDYVDLRCAADRDMAPAFAPVDANKVSSGIAPT